VRILPAVAEARGENYLPLNGMKSNGKELVCESNPESRVAFLNRG
jgi:hypothetical protein